MKLMTKELEKKMPGLYTTEEIETDEKVIIAKYFTPMSNWTWYAVEYDPNDGLFFGLVEGHDRSWGYFSLGEFEEVNKGYPIPMIERDLHFTPTKVKDLQD